MILILVGTAAYGIVGDRSPSTLNNAAFAALHATVLGFGVRYALIRRRDGGTERDAEPDRERAREPDLAGDPA
jgi:hypothetical protein